MSSDLEYESENEVLKSSAINDESESIELSCSDDEEEEIRPQSKFQLVASYGVKKPRSSGLSTIHEESQMPSLSRQSFTLTSSFVSPVQENTTASTNVRAQDHQPISEEQKSVVSQSTLSHVSNRPSEHKKQNRSQLSISSNGTLSKTRVLSQVQALKPVERLDISTIMSSMNPRSKFLKQKQKAVLNESEIVFAERSSNAQLQVSGRSIGASKRPIHDSSTSKSRSSKSRTLSSHSSICAPSETTKRNSSDIALDITPSVLAFGFVDMKKSHCTQLTIRNSSDRSICFEPSILSDEKENTVFEVKSLSSFTVEANNTFHLDVYFSPKSYGSFNAQLRLTTIGLDSTIYRVGMFGFGARAQLSFCQHISQRTEPIEFGTDGIGLCWIDRNQTSARLVLRNISQRSAFAYLHLTDGLNQPVSEHHATVFPERMILLNNESKIVDFKFPHGISALLHESRSVSRLSTVSGQSTRTVANEQLVRLHVYWGEERQRQRLKIFFQENENERRTFHGIDFATTEFAGENGDLAAKLTGSYDVQIFTQGLRRTTIQFYDNHVRPMSTYASRTNLYEKDGTLARSMNTFCDNTHLQPVAQDETLRRPKTLHGRRLYY
ncbi:hypothetical protein M3Y98_00444700 [Aphelenchoides besseyi]|nr:hypothetical protein M3Y98_00441400 [Aphelenchoides besseyi]KAI6189270.1 hypothetical protein M3Y98_00444700 [Aphelenchoides besseyi]KAI6202579.1 hypothetical protein M3Y96_00963800 [Aphelenchoides besseyi]